MVRAAKAHAYLVLHSNFCEFATGLHKQVRRNFMVEQAAALSNTFLLFALLQGASLIAVAWSLL